MPEAPGSPPGGTSSQPSRPFQQLSAEALAALVRGSSEGMMLTDERGFVTLANPSCERLLGISLEQLMGRLWFDLWPAEHVPVARDAFVRCIESPGNAVTCQVQVERPDGEPRSIAVRLLNALQTSGFDGIVVFVTEARPGKRDVDESYRALFDSAVTGLGVADLEGNLLAFNDAMLKPGSYTREDILRLGNVSLLYADPEDRERVLRIADEKGFVWREEVKFVRKDGSSYDTLLTLSPVHFEGRRAWYATVEDVSEQRRADRERRELEVQLWQAQKMQAVGSMTAGIAHDFNNILTVILTSAELISLELTPDAEEVREELEALRTAAKRGSQMISKLLGFSRTWKLEVDSTNVADVVDELHPTLKRLIPEDILLETSLAERSTARCDRGAVAEMLLNLATNACEAMPAGGTLRIAIGPAVMASDTPERPSWMTPGEFVRVSVSDNGMGMDEATKARVLEPFFTTKPPGAGTGLGLSMVYGLAKQQGGFIDVLSEQGNGTTVHLYFPAVA